MPTAHEQMMEEKRQYIIKTLEWFDLKLTPSDGKKLDKDNDISVSAYLDDYLVPCIPKLYKARNDYGMWGTKEAIQFRGLISLCFNGDLSQKVSDKIWARFDDEEKIYFATADYYLGLPLTVAAKAGNIKEIKRLDAIFRAHPEAKAKIHWQLRCALFNYPVKSNNEQQCLDLLLKLCEYYAEPVNIVETTQRFENKRLAYRQSGPFVSEEGFTTLLAMFIEVCEQFVRNQNLGALTRVCSYLTKHGITEDEFASFNAKISAKLQKLNNERFRNAGLTLLERAKNSLVNSSVSSVVFQTNPAIQSVGTQPVSNIPVFKEQSTETPARPASSDNRVPETPGQTEKPCSTIQRIDLILKSFQAKISDPDGSAQKLFEQLCIARNEYLQVMNNEADPDASGQQFLKTCKEEIKKARPILEKELGWGDFLVNLIKELANAVISIVSLGTTNSFFAKTKSDSIVAVEKAEKDLSDTIDSKQYN